MADVGGTLSDRAAAPRADKQAEVRGTWVAAGVSLALLSISYGSPLVLVVGLKAITEDLGTIRQVVALAAALTWIGTGSSGILMGWVADRIGIRRTVLFGAVMIAAGLALSSTGSIWAIYVGQGVLLGLGNGAVFPPLLVYVSRWFDQRRGAALALISSGQYIAGMIWPTVFEETMARYGWQDTMLFYAVVCLVAIPPLALVFLHPAPVAPIADASSRRAAARRSVLGLRPNLVLGILSAAGFCCCVPMALPQSHLVAFCSDVGVSPTNSALMLSVMTGCAFVSRQFWGWLADRVGGLLMLICGEACQTLAIAGFLATQNEAGLFAVAAAFGLGFSGIVPAYVLIVRELFPSAEASWRVPTVLFVSMGGMAFGSWFAGALYDHFGFYGPAFAAGVLFNLANIALVGFLVLRSRSGHGGLQPAAA
jgi:MFS family permease